MTKTRINRQFRPRRSCLYMPGSNERAIEKTRSLPADTVIFDLEDAVAPGNKEAARKGVSDALAAGGFGHREVVIRINALDTAWGGQDLQMAIAAKPDAILVPKIMSAEDIHGINDAMEEAGAPDSLAMWVMIEMPLAILNIAEIAAAATATRLTTFVLGTNDLAKELRARMTPDRIAFQAALQLSVAAARAHGLNAIDGVFNDIPDLKGLEVECEQGRDLGFDGKTLIHPAQLEICNKTFSPETAEIDHARAVIAAFADQASSGQGVINVNGKMTELLHLEEARRMITIADAIAQIESKPG